MEKSIREQKNGLRVQTTVCDRQIATEIASEFSIPDYQPEIKRILRVQATVLPADRYIGVGNADFSGRVDYRILYVAADGALYSTIQSEPYQFSTPLELNSDFELNDGFVCDVESVCDMAVGRLIAPRKFSVKCRLRSRVRIYGTQCREVSMIGGDSDELQKLCGSADCAKLFCGVGETFILGDDVLCDAQAGDLRVICGEGQVFVTEAVAGSGVVNCRGEVALKLLCCRDGGDTAPSPILRRIPFTQSVALDGVEINCDATAEGVCRDLQITVEEGRVLCEVGVCLTVRAQRNERVSFIRDLYSTCSESEQSYISCAFLQAVKCVNGNFSIGTALPLEDAGIKSNAALIDFSLVPMLTGFDCEHGKYHLSGRARCAAVTVADGELSVQEFEIPFRYECDGTADAVADYNATVSPISCRARMDGERIGVDAELAVCLSTRGESCIQMLSQAKFGEAVPHMGASYTVCYPAREDTLWSVAKRYHRSVDAISEINSLAGAPAADAKDSLAGVKYLLV